ncbi:hypothetical protein D3C81_1948970 [compost metagenome]
MELQGELTQKDTVFVADIQQMLKGTVEKILEDNRELFARLGKKLPHESDSH